jgi:hypothetical protein
VAVCGALELIGFLYDDFAFLRPAALAAAGLVALAVALAGWLGRRSARRVSPR